MQTDDLFLDPSLARATSLPSRWYTKPEALELEQERLFPRTWQYAGPAAKVSKPGSFFTCDVLGEPLVVLRDEQGALRSFFNVCRHRGGPVAQGEGNCKALRCAYHGWTYGLNGDLKVTPEFRGAECFEKAAFGLRQVAVDVFGPFVFVRFEANGPSLGEVLGQIPDETGPLSIGKMEPFKRVTYEVECNWKVYVDNYLEGYHIPHVHPGLMKAIDYPAYRTETFRYYSKQYAPVKGVGEQLYTRNLPPGAEPVALYYWIFPNLMLNVYPDNIQINAILPLGHDRTVTLFEWFLMKPDRPEANSDFEQSFNFADLIQKEDLEICAQVQKGLSSRSYQAGRYSVERENGVHHFHELYGEFMRKESP